MPGGMQKKGQRERPRQKREFKEDMCLVGLIQLFMDTEFQSYAFLAGNTKGYGGDLIASQLLKEKMVM